MKTVLKFLLVATCIGLWVACDESEDLSGTDLKKAPQACPEIVVEPEAGFDTENLVAAFEEAKMMGPGTVIRLTEGTYTIGMIEVHDFDGTLTGAGQGKTIITNLPELPCEEYFLANKTPAMLTFIGGNVTISGMTLLTQDGEPCARGYWQDQIYGDLAAFICIGDYSSDYFPDNRTVRGVVDHVDFIAGDDGGYGTYGTKGNVAMELYCGTTLWWITEDVPLSKGNITISNCTFKDGFCGPDLCGFDENSHIVIKNNTIEDCSYQMCILANMGATYDICNNRLSGATAMDIYLEGSDYGYFPASLPPETITKFKVTGNLFQTPPGLLSLYITDYYRVADPDNIPEHLYEVKGNVFDIGEGATAIWSANIKNAKIWNNQFLGTGSVGVWLDGDEASGTFSEGNQLTGNNFLEAAYIYAAVYLGPVTRNNKVVGMPGDLVVDEGTNNKIIGTKAQKHGVPPLRPLFKGMKPLK